MKKAFTLLELVFVIVVIGILAAIIIPSTKTNPVREAAIQLVSHIRYTQHLAMMDDRFNATDPKWYMEMWQIRFTNGNGTSDGKPAYVIFSDTSHTQHPEKSECAVDPLTGLLLNGGVVNDQWDDPDFLQATNIGNEYGITSVMFGSECNNAMRIAFDHFGRPIEGDISSPSTSSTLTGALKYITGTCTITISNGSDSEVILIEPESGYIHIQ
ncbi:type II secretion system GspH family protein [Sulfurimonas sp.]|nr:type II secretion system GspH family protein [Sulfurimonas sp.]